MASIQKYKSGFRAFIVIQGVRKSKTFATKREAVAWASATETAIRESADSHIGDKYTLADAMKRYLDEISPSKRGSRWELIRIESLLASDIFPSDQKIRSITPAILSKWRDQRLLDVKSSTVLRDFSLLSAIFEAARREWRWIDSNPVHDVRKPTAPEHRNITITWMQIRKMCKEMGYSSRKPIRTVAQATACCFLTALCTGMRAGELCNLTWSCVFEHHVHLPITKTKKRDVPLSKQAKFYITKMKDYDPSLVFGLTSSSLDANFRKYRKRAGLEGFTFHDARHTAATWMASRMKSKKGISAQQAVLDMCKIFGWANVSQALVYYNPDMKDIAQRLC